MSSSEQLVKVATKVARRYARRCWWADEEDLRQEAMVAALECLKEGRWDPEVGVPLNAYAWRACVNHLRSYLWRQSSPVSETDHNLENLRGVHHIEIPEDGFQDRVEPVEVLLDQARWNHAVREQVLFVLGAVGVDRVVLRTLFDDDKPADVAEELGIPRNTLYRSLQRARTALRDNAMLYELMKEVR